MRERVVVLKLYKKYKSVSDFDQFKSLRNKVKRDIRKAIANFASDLLKHNSGKKLWNGLSKLGIGKT